MMPINYIEHRTCDEIKLGDSATIARTLKPADIQLFAIRAACVRLCGVLGSRQDQGHTLVRGRARRHPDSAGDRESGNMLATQLEYLANARRELRTEQSVLA